MARSRKYGPKQPCPCESGKESRDCHKIRQIRALEAFPGADPNAHSIIHKTTPGPIYVSTADYSSGVAQACPGCGTVIVVGLGVNQIEGLVFKCGECGATSRSYR